MREHVSKTIADIRQSINEVRSEPTAASKPAQRQAAERKLRATKYDAAAAAALLEEPFTAPMLIKATGLSKGGASGQINRWLRRGMIERVEAGKYVRTKSFPTAGDTGGSAASRDAQPHQPAAREARSHQVKVPGLDDEDKGSICRADREGAEGSGPGARGRARDAGKDLPGQDRQTAGEAGMKRIIIKVREYGGAYIARSGGKTASCTSHPRYAAERVAMRVAGLETDCGRSSFVPFDRTGIKLSESSHGCYSAELPEP